MRREEARKLKFRYLLWFYKTVKEELDRIERKFTQLEVDKAMLKLMKKEAKGKGLDKFLRDFEGYIINKEQEVQKAIKSQGRCKPEYRYSLLKLEAIEKVIVSQLGKKDQERIKELYQDEMVKRILESKGH